MYKYVVMNAEAIKNLVLRSSRKTDKHEVNKDYLDLFGRKQSKQYKFRIMSNAKKPIRVA
jgi:hypothetical protein